MATLTAVNPRIVSGPTPTTVRKLIKNGASWKAGQFLIDDTGLAAAKSNAVNIKYQAITDQTDPGNATTFAEVYVIDPDHVFRINELDGTVSAANIGKLYSVDVTSNVCTVDVADNDTPCFVMVDVGSNRSPVEFADVDVKGVCYVRFIQSVLDT